MSYTSYAADVGPRTDVRVALDRYAPATAAGVIRLHDPDTHTSVQLSMPVDVLCEIACLAYRSDPQVRAAIAVATPAGGA